MPRKEGQKRKLLVLLQILARETDERHPLSVPQIVEKLKEKGESLELDENENIKGWENTVSALKTQFPNMFENASDDNGDGYQRVDNGQLDHGKNDGSYTRKDILKMPYSERLKVFNEEPEAYQEAMNTK